MPKFDREKFNTDPKHEQERADFDAMLEDSLKRISEKTKKNNPPAPDPEGFLDGLFKGIFGTETPKKD